MLPSKTFLCQLIDATMAVASKYFALLSQRVDDMLLMLQLLNFARGRESEFAIAEFSICLSRVWLEKSDVFVNLGQMRLLNTYWLMTEVVQFWKNNKDLWLRQDSQ